MHIVPVAPNSSIKSLAFGDIEREIAVTRRILERLPDDQFAWKVHDKSMSLGDLAAYVANLLAWATSTVAKDFFDMADPGPAPSKPARRADLLATFDANAVEFRAAWAKVSDTELAKPWSVRKGTQILHAEPKAAILRKWCISHLIHHRAQLCVYLRLLNVPVPAVYFNSADEPDWKFE